MDGIVASVIALMLVLGSMFTVIGGVFKASQVQADSFTAARAQAVRDADGSVAPVSAVASTTLGITDVDVTVTNRGRLVYSLFQGWDVIVRYTDSLGNERVERTPYADVLAAGAWTSQQILLDSSLGSPELVDPGLLNPHEELVVRIRLSNTIGAGTTNVVTITPPEGGGGYVSFSG